MMPSQHPSNFQSQFQSCTPSTQISPSPLYSLTASQSTVSRTDPILKPSVIPSLAQRLMPTELQSQFPTHTEDMLPSQHLSYIPAKSPSYIPFTSTSGLSSLFPS